MDRIIVDVKPFIFSQKIYCYEGDEITLVVKTNMSDLAQTVFDLADKMKINDINLAGNHKYLSKIKDEIIQCEHTKYGVRNINVKLI